MSAVCDVCGKGPGFGNNVSHSHRRTRRRFNANIQTTRISLGGTTRRIRICTKCLKAGKLPADARTQLPRPSRAAK